MSAVKLSAISLILLALLSSCNKSTVQAGPVAFPPTPVTVAKATQESVPFEIRVVGSSSPSATVQVKSQVAGQIIGVHFTEGQNVAKDALLFEIDSRPYQEALKQAEAMLARDRAQLRQAEANMARDLAQLKNAQADAVRYAEMTKEGIISKQQNDQVQTSADVYRESSRASQAAIESARAAVQSDQSSIDKAKLDIAYCRITAPISGRAGNLLVNAGNLVAVNGNSPLVVINQISPIFVTFNVPEQHLSVIRRLQAQHPLEVVGKVDDNTRSTTGRLTVIDNSVDATTGTIPLKATFDNRDGLLWPGQFVNVGLRLETIQNAVVVPAEAIQAGQRGQFVYVVKADKTVEPRPVTPGRTFQNRTIIQQGVAAGETVVTDGFLRLAPGVKIEEVAPVPLVGIEKS
jgi:multidrug efflux system membrane fusion protein